MAAFHTNVLRNGVWVTETVDAGAALRASVEAPKTTEQAKPENTLLGVLSRTVVHNPKVNLILPVCLRSRDYNDIAFIGDQSIHIKEQKNDGQQIEVLPHHHFEARIRNALVMGAPPATAGEKGEVKTESLDHDIDMIRDDSGLPPRTRTLPPQILVLILETGELCFVFIETDPQGLALKLFIKKLSLPSNVPYLGHHFAIEPSFRYIAAASPDEVLVIFHLQGLERLAQEYARSGTFEPLLERTSRLIRAVIHSVDFLYPRPQDDFHVILTVTVCTTEPVKKRAWRMYTFDWEVGEQLSDTFSPQRQVTPLRLPELPEIPSFLIPLRFQSTFFMVFRSHVCLVKQALTVPEYEFTPIPNIQQSNLHYGIGEPLWTAWARPFRRKSYTENTDIIYLAREDGIVIHLELESDSLMYSVTQIGCLDINIGRAFTAAYDIYSDLLIIGGDAGPGGVWKLPARSELQQISSIQNWSPVIDAVATDDKSTTDLKEGARTREAPGAQPGKPARLFLATRRGEKGTLVEPRVGMQARIGLDMDFGEPTREAWMFSDIRQRDGSLYAIIALPHSSTVLCFSADFKAVQAETGESTPFDTSSRTIFATQSQDDMVIQVTEASVTLVTASQSSRHSFENILAVPGASAQMAHCVQDVILTYVQSDQGSCICVLRVDQMAVSLESTWEVQEELNCLSLLTCSVGKYVISGSLSAKGPSISVFTLAGDLLAGQQLCEGGDVTDVAPKIEALTGFVMAGESSEGLIVAAGTRCGHLVTIHIHGLPSRVVVSWTSEKIGLSSALVFPGADSHLNAFCCCDDRLLSLSRPSSGRPRFEGKDIVWPIDLNDSWSTFPPIHSVFSLRHGLYQSSRGGTLLLLADTRILLAEFCIDVAPVPRIMDLPGAPTKMLYSEFWKCLLVSVQTSHTPMLLFIDPETGDTISRPVDRDRKGVDNISGLGSLKDRICGLHEWIYVKDGKTFPFIVVTTQSGSLLIVSVLETFENLEDGTSSRKLEYYTRYRRKGFSEPVYSVVPDEEGLVYCVGRTLHWDILDLEEKKIKPACSIELDSAATTLSRIGTKILALTSRHSLEVIQRQRTGDNYVMALLHTDARTRPTSHMVMMGPAEDGKRWPVNLVSDLSGGITGLWVPWQKPSQDLLHVCEGRLKSSVRRFARAKYRQPWSVQDQGGGKYGSVQSTPDDADILGVSLNGTVQQFKLLGLHLWRVMYLIQNAVLGKDPREDGLHNSVLRQRWGDEAPPELHAGLMHIDGDALMGCLQSRSLERLMADADVAQLLFFCLDELEDGEYTRNLAKEGCERHEQYFGLAYRILEYLLTSVL